MINLIVAVVLDAFAEEDKADEMKLPPGQMETFLGMLVALRQRRHVLHGDKNLQVTDHGPSCHERREPHWIPQTSESGATALSRRSDIQRHARSQNACRSSRSLIVRATLHSTTCWRALASVLLVAM